MCHPKTKTTPISMGTMTLYQTTVVCFRKKIWKIEFPRPVILIKYIPLSNGQNITFPFSTAVDQNLCQKRICLLCHWKVSTSTLSRSSVFCLIGSFNSWRDLHFFPPDLKKKEKDPNKPKDDLSPRGAVQLCDDAMPLNIVLFAEGSLAPAASS